MAGTEKLAGTEDQDRGKIRQIKMIVQCPDGYKEVTYDEKMD